MYHGGGGGGGDILIPIPPSYYGHLTGGQFSVALPPPFILCRRQMIPPSIFPEIENHVILRNPPIPLPPTPLCENIHLRKKRLESKLRRKYELTF